MLQFNKNYNIQKVSSNSREGLTNSESPMLGRKPRKSSMLINTDLDDDEDFYDEDHDDFEETLEKINEGKNKCVRISSYIFV